MADIESILWEMFDEDRGQFGASGSPTYIAEVLTGKLTSGEAVEQAARAIARAENAVDWAEEIDRWERLDEWEREAYPEGYPGMAYECRGQFREAARAALTAAIRGENDD